MSADIHNPTVGAAPSTVGQEDISLSELIAKKERLEEELSALGSVLDSVGNPLALLRNAFAETKQHGVTMATGLTTFDGFPRSDIDVAQSQCSIASAYDRYALAGADAVNRQFGPLVLASYIYATTTRLSCHG